MVRYPNLISAMSTREITKKTLADALGISGKALGNKLSGRVEFKFREAEKIQAIFFDDIPILHLFATSDTEQSAPASQNQSTRSRVQ